MGVEERHGWGGLLWVLELFYAHFKPGDVFPHELGSCLALSIIVLAAVCLLGADALCTSRLSAITSLVQRGAWVGHR